MRCSGEAGATLSGDLDTSTETGGSVVTESSGASTSEDDSHYSTLTFELSSPQPLILTPTPALSNSSVGNVSEVASPPPILPESEDHLSSSIPTAIPISTGQSYSESTSHGSSNDDEEITTASSAISTIDSETIQSDTVTEETLSFSIYSSITTVTESTISFTISSSSSAELNDESNTSTTSGISGERSTLSSQQTDSSSPLEAETSETLSSNNATDGMSTSSPKYAPEESASTSTLSLDTTLTSTLLTSTEMTTPETVTVSDLEREGRGEAVACLQVGSCENWCGGGSDLTCWCDQR